MTGPQESEGAKELLRKRASPNNFSLEQGPFILHPLPCPKESEMTIQGLSYHHLPRGSYCCPSDLPVIISGGANSFQAPPRLLSSAVKPQRQPRALFLSSNGDAYSTKAKRTPCFSHSLLPRKLTSESSIYPRPALVWKFLGNSVTHAQRLALYKG